MSIQRRAFIATVGGGLAVGSAGCLGNGGSDEGDGMPDVSGTSLTLTTTTSTEDSGLLTELNPPFEEHYGVTVEAVPQGTGNAIETARRGDSDVVMVHARSLEDEFMEDGYGVNRRDLMFNDFVVVGPSDDPAEINGSESVVEAFEAIADTGSTFVSRGDNSGTYTKEQELWGETSLGEPSGEWYRSIGSGMGDALNQANLDGTYTLSDRGTFLSMRSDLDLEIHVQGPIEGGPELLSNPYGIVAVNPEIHDNVEYTLAMAYIGYVTSPEAQSIIEEYTANGEQLFYPDALSEDPNFQQYVPEGWQSDDET
ncbi:substrate-binding domain-containing protein [Natrialba sp. PRR66]|uniref:substrate-binding domain-containing protein n=1 Tax=Natrialba sp. PRR66 TaxID=3098146 RepID=UPI002B1D2550|nr:substrate-binding domain-containing protein [Natrialba sp. PRR66]